MPTSGCKFRVALQRLNIERLLPPPLREKRGSNTVGRINNHSSGVELCESVNKDFKDVCSTVGNGARGVYCNGLPFHVRWDRIQRNLAVLGRVSNGSTVVPYRDSAEAFRVMWKAVDEAKRSVLWQTYICKDDRIGQMTVEKIAAAQRRGCQSELLYDCGGNITGRRRLIDKLKQSGANVIEHRPVLHHVLPYLFGGMKWERSPAIRNHRKILIVDDKIGFCGGLNIGNEYCGRSQGGTGRFRDTHCSVVGPAVAHLREAYEDTKAPKPWQWSWTRWRKIASTTMARRYKQGRNATDDLLGPMTKSVQQRGKLYLQQQMERAEEKRVRFMERIRWKRQRERLELFMRWYPKKAARLLPQNLVHVYSEDGTKFPTERAVDTGASKVMKQRMEHYRMRALNRAKAALERRLAERPLSKAPLSDADPVPGAEEYDKIRPNATQIICCNPHTRDWSIPYAFWQVSQKAHRRLWVTTPYYLPHRKLLRAILYAARRGVDVRILAGSNCTTDPWFMWHASNYITERLLAAGVRIYEYKGDQIMHAKTVVVDSIWCSVGSYNWDMMSNKNMEVCLCHLGYEMAREMEGHFLKDLQTSIEVKYEEYQRRSLWLRFTSWFFYVGLQIAEKLTFRTFWDADLSSKVDDLD
ncbi:putative cardiolipin synthetase [Trypanosoma cruzi]|uniref:Cardiolipin synthetase, putative n=2 Tax=Trypanosoma cruzi TaxID=5693 RepID=Q4CVT1_TRYCC|nr:cardiolipin synthetase, putative [Trypanosoma cruzi]EAN84381.1 cardiolipin synthetase, putative [Trypanosoma cruzi]PWV05469.1 putative cardiolipin synthetase [Trypanosoma cruzi]RNC54839.1 putative cardiolipin synthetase [Trypanosoma cruzi]|eukprot:XP_806232.1 cardiolipin synthetase [Trypanosoma cruzi strain CL Brener]